VFGFSQIIIDEADSSLKELDIFLELGRSNNPVAAD
jgi:hypothetical protein